MRKSFIKLTALCLTLFLLAGAVGCNNNSNPEADISEADSTVSRQETPSAEGLMAELIENGTIKPDTTAGKIEPHPQMLTPEIAELEEEEIADSEIMLASVIPVQASDKTEKPLVLPSKKEPAAGLTVYSNEKAVVDASNLGEGYVMVRYTGGKDVRIKIQITKDGKEAYTYNLNNQGSFESFPLSEGDGSYSIRVFENIAGTKYAQAYACTVSMNLRNDFLPFLYPNQYVNYSGSSAAVAQAAQLIQGSSGELDSLERIYDYVINNFTYDYDLANSVSSGYLPDVDKVLEVKKGICFDYAALISAMLRSQNIPSKLVVGYAETEYHAWINVYIENIGWIDQAIYFDGVNWSFMDPTFVSSARQAGKMDYVPDQQKYRVKYVY